MAEEYFIEEQNKNEPTIKIDYFVNKVFEKQKEDYGEISASITRDRVRNIFKQSLILEKSTTKNKNVLLVGKVQSGKTSNLEMFTAFAFDNGFKCVIIYGGYDNKLLYQTSSRFKKTFDVDDENVETKEPELFSTDDNESVNSLDEDVLHKIVELDKPIIFVSMKRPGALAKVNDALTKIQNHNLRTFIIDDEGDQASLNTQFKNNKKSATYDAIYTMKKILNNPLYLSVTATPQANVLLGEYSILKPEKLFLIEPGDGYTGSEFFHLDDKHIVEVDPDDVKILNNDQVPSSLYDSINYFLVASALMKKRGFSYTDMIIHTERKNIKHQILYSTIYEYIQSMKENIGNDDELSIQLKPLQKIYNNLYFSGEILSKYQFDSLIDDLKSVIKDTHLILQDSTGKATQGNEKYRNHKIYIGGDLLQRGLTFKYLITTYFTRWPKNAGNMDTTIQRARWFGYRSKFLDLCKVFTTQKIQLEYSGLTESENDLWEQCYSIQKGELSIEDIVIDANSTSLNPTRKNVVSYKTVKIRSKWNNQKQGFFDKAINATNNSFISKYLNKFTYTPSTVGRIGVETPSCFYSYISKEDAIELVSGVSSIFDHPPFSRPDLKKMFKDMDNKIVIEKMFGLYKEDDVRLRSFYKESNKIFALQQGPDKADEALKKYKGDAKVIVDEEAIIIQVFRIRPRYDKKHELPEFDQYMFSIHVPEDRKGFVKSEFKAKNPAN